MGVCVGVEVDVVFGVADTAAYVCCCVLGLFCPSIAALFAGHLNATAGWGPEQLKHFSVVEGHDLWLCPVSAHLEQMSTVAVH